MLPYPKTLKSQLFVVFLFFNGLIVLLSSVSIIYIRQGEKMDMAKTWVGQLEIQTRDLLREDLQHKYQDEEGIHDRLGYLSRRSAYMREIRILIQQLVRQEPMQHPSIQEDIFYLDSLLTAYNEDFYHLMQRELPEQQRLQEFRKLETTASFIRTEFGSIETTVSLLFSDAMDNARHNFLYMVACCLLLAFGVGYLAIRVLSRPLQQLTEQVERYHQGNLQQGERIAVHTPMREVQELAVAFEEMRTKIAVQLQDIAQAQQCLEGQNRQLRLVNERLSDSEGQLKGMNQVQTKFFSIISHDLRGPLATQTNFLRMLANNAEGFSKEETKQLATEIYDSMQQLQQLMENLLSWSRSQAGRMSMLSESVEVETLLERNFALLRPRAEQKQVALARHIAADARQVLADYNMLDFVVRNLLENALKYSYAGCRIDVHAHVDTEEFCLRIADQGTGMSPEQLDQIFQEQTVLSMPGTAEEKGTGLGLLLCKEFVDRHRGRIWAESEQDKGTTFYVCLPHVRSWGVANKA